MIGYQMHRRSGGSGLIEEISRAGSISSRLTLCPGNKRIHLLAAVWLTSLSLVPACVAGPTNALAQLQNVRRIVFLGDSITYAGQYVEAVEAYFVTRFPNRRLEFLNLGLPSETVSG